MDDGTDTDDDEKGKSRRLRYGSRFSRDGSAKSISVSVRCQRHNSFFPSSPTLPQSKPASLRMTRFFGMTNQGKGGKYHCPIDLLFDWFEISCMTTDNFCFYLQNGQMQTSQTGGQWYSDTSPFSIPWSND
jgi:hypothetical protein